MRGAFGMESGDASRYIYIVPTFTEELVFVEGFHCIDFINIYTDIFKLHNCKNIYAMVKMQVACHFEHHSREMRS